MDKAKNKNGGSFKITGNWKAWSKQIKEKFARMDAKDLKFEKTKEPNKIIKQEEQEKIQVAIRNAGKK